MTYKQRLSLFILIDSAIVLAAILVSHLLVRGTFLISSWFFIVSTFAILLSHHLFSFKFKLYKKAWEYASVGELIIILKTATASIITAAVFQGILLNGMFVRRLSVTWLLLVMLIGGSRFCWRIYRDLY